MRGALTAPVEVDVRGKLVDLHALMLDARTLGIELDDRSSRSARNAAAGMQRAARAFGQQSEIVGVDAEIEVQLARRADVAIELEAGSCPP